MLPGREIEPGGGRVCEALFRRPQLIEPRFEVCDEESSIDPAVDRTVAALVKAVQPDVSIR
jgi:hypothetical protein